VLDLRLQIDRQNGQIFSEQEGKYQEIFLDFRKKVLHLGSEIRGTKNTSDPAMLAPLSPTIGNNFS